MTTGLTVNPFMFGGDAYGAQLAAFANAYSSTDPYGSSIFSDYNYAVPMMGAMGFDPTMYSTNMYGKWDYTKYEKKWKEQSIEHMTRQDAIMNLHSFAMNDQQDKFNVAYKNAIKIEQERLLKIMPDASPDKLNAAARASINNTYQQMTGQPLIQTIKENGDHPIWQGIKDVLSLGLDDRTKREDNMELIAGNKHQKSIGATAGRVLGGAAAGAAIGAAVGSVVPVPVISTAVGAIAGGVIGGAISLFKSL